MYSALDFYYGSGEASPHHDVQLMQFPIEDSRQCRVGLFASSDGLLQNQLARARASKRASRIFAKCRVWDVVAGPHTIEV